MTLDAEVAELTGRFVVASNATFLGRTPGGYEVVYKPVAGQRPLWDFDAATLPMREVLTYELATVMGFDVVPQTVFGTGPYGPGSIQRYVEEDEAFDPVPLVRNGDDALWPIAILDVIANNADRKLGHIIRAEERIYAVDHGLTFHADPKLRTVLWAFAGRPIPPELRVALRAAAGALDGDLGARVASELSPLEERALRARIDELIARAMHPLPPDDRPALPWPPY